MVLALLVCALERLERLECAGPEIHPENHGIAVVLQPYLPVYRSAFGMDHVYLGCVVVPLGRKNPGLEFLSLPVESGDPSLIHGGKAQVALLIELQPKEIGRASCRERV